MRGTTHLNKLIEYFDMVENSSSSDRLQSTTSYHHCVLLSHAIVFKGFFDVVHVHITKQPQTKESIVFF